MNRRLATPLVVILIASLAFGCTSDEVSRPDGVSVALVTDRGAAQELNLELTRANGAPSGPGGLMRGIAVVFSRTMPDGVRVADIEFADDATSDYIAQLEERIRTLGLDAVWLEDGDEWPFCEGSSDCPVVGERL